MATTTNYGWSTPDDVSLVKDGASAIRTLGSSVDTTVKNLNPETTLGDLAYRSSTANVKTRLPLGTANQLLQVNSGGTAPEWVSLSTGGMTVLASGSMSGASVSLTSISTSYNNLQLVIRDYLPSTDGAGLMMRVNNLSGSNYAAMSTTSSRTNVSFSGTEFVLLNHTNVTSDASVTVQFLDYTSTTTWKMQTTSIVMNNAGTTTNADLFIQNGAVNTTSAITRIDFYPFSGTFTGSYILYGVK
jgi:hypothetical protein